MIDKTTIIIIFFGLYLNFCTIQSTMIGLYDDTKDDIEILNKTTFNSVIYGSDKVSFVEFYAQWWDNAFLIESWTFIIFVIFLLGVVHAKDTRFIGKKSPKKPNHGIPKWSEWLL